MVKKESQFGVAVIVRLRIRRPGFKSSLGHKAPWLALGQLSLLLSLSLTYLTSLW